MRPTTREFSEAVWRLASVIPYFPQGKLAVEVIQQEIESFVATREQLQWLTQTACRVMTNFSLPELRGIFCTRYQPADGLYTAAQSPGFTPEDSMAAAESEFHKREADEDARKLAEWKVNAKLLNAAPDRAPLRLLPAAKPVEQPAAPAKPSVAELEAKLAEAQKTASFRTDEELQRLAAELKNKARL